MNFDIQSLIENGFSKVYKLVYCKKYSFNLVVMMCYKVKSINESYIITVYKWGHPSSGCHPSAELTLNLPNQAGACTLLMRIGLIDPSIVLTNQYSNQWLRNWFKYR